MKFAGLVEYDGSGFSGWAAQPGRRTVEDSLMEAFRTVLRQPVKLSVAGRTDAGVHASGQVISFSADTVLAPKEIAYKVTAVLPKDLALRRCASVPEDFDARRNARSRSYEYRITNDPVRSPLTWDNSNYVARKLDFELLKKAATLILGAHEFRAFTPSRTYHVRFGRAISESSWMKNGDLLVYRITADSFLYGMVRTLVGTMIEVSEGKRTLEDFGRLITGGVRKEAGHSAPARGLTLVEVGYDDLNLKRSLS
ncbi:MAG: tRNA pseudouridine(38-40) synthase TruA [Rubrobacteraceae bacterium]